MGAVIFGSWNYKLVDLLENSLDLSKTIYWGILKSEVCNPKSFRSRWVIFLYNFLVIFQLFFECVLPQMEKEKWMNHLLIVIDTVCQALYQMVYMHHVIETAQWGLGIINPIFNIGKPEL